MVTALPMIPAIRAVSVGIVTATAGGIVAVRVFFQIRAIDAGIDDCHGNPCASNALAWTSQHRSRRDNHRPETSASNPSLVFNAHIVNPKSTDSRSYCGHPQEGIYIHAGMLR